MSELFTNTISEFIKIIPILILAVLASQILRVYLTKDKLENNVKENEKNIVKASALGLVSPGPLMAYLPSLKALFKKGLAPSILVAFITVQTLIGPGRILLEIDYFGVVFLLLRVVLAFFIAVAAATIFRWLEKRIRF